MQEKSVILTQNNRLAKYLHKEFRITSSGSNLTTWPTPTILPLSTWLENCWYKSPDPRVLLSKQQERLLWRKIITENLDNTRSNLTSLIADSYELVTNWVIKEIDGKGYYETEDINTFKYLYKKFKKYCKNKNLVTTSELPTLIIPYISNYNFTKITFIGFDEYTPQLQLLIATIKNAGCLVLEIDPNSYLNSTQKLIGFDKPNLEIAASAIWANKLINEDPNRSIGIVVPNLLALRSNVHQIFTEILPNNKNFNISAGIPLNTLPIINLALEILSLDNPLDLKIINSLLSSPYVIDAEIEQSERALFKHQLNLLGHQQFSIIDIQKLAKKYTLNIPLIIKALQNWYSRFIKIKTKFLHHAEWMQLFAEFLQIFGWPGKNNLTDLESTAIQHLIKSIANVTAANLFLGKTSYKNALQILQESINHTTLQPEAETDVPINIFGTLEATGINFDYLWVMGLDQENWPPAPRSTPFIPIEIQKKLSLPHSSTERELHFSKILIDRYNRSAKEIIFSYVNQADGNIIEPSSLISNVPKISTDDLKLIQATSWSQKIYFSKKIETIENDNAPQLAATEITHTGSRLIELQSSCPFRAFMEFRLATKEPQKPELGISKIKRGMLIHSTLEKIWQKIKSQQELCSLDPYLLQQLIQENVDFSLNKLEIPQIFYNLEKQCVAALITKWLEIEKKRQPFQVIATEKPVQINLSSLPIKLRIDRIDQLTTGDILLIDYKTGKFLPSIFDWFGTRPKAPQFPLYSLAVDAIHGLALAQINIDSLKFKEININELNVGLRAVDVASDLSKNPENSLTWDELITYWRDILTKIANDFMAGYASPTPLSPQICKQCSFGAVCRIKY